MTRARDDRKRNNRLKVTLDPERARAIEGLILMAGKAITREEFHAQYEYRPDRAEASSDIPA